MIVKSVHGRLPFWEFFGELCIYFSEPGGINRVSVMIAHEKAEFLVCTLDNKHVYQQPLDLNFSEGEEVTFFLNGQGIVPYTYTMSGAKNTINQVYLWSSTDLENGQLLRIAVFILDFIERGGTGPIGSRKWGHELTLRLGCHSLTWTFFVL